MLRNTRATALQQVSSGPGEIKVTKVQDPACHLLSILDLSGSKSALFPTGECCSSHHRAPAGNSYIHREPGPCSVGQVRGPSTLAERGTLGSAFSLLRGQQLC